MPDLFENTLSKVIFFPIISRTIRPFKGLPTGLFPFFFSHTFFWCIFE